MMKLIPGEQDFLRHDEWLHLFLSCDYHLPTHFRLED